MTNGKIIKIVNIILAFLIIGTLLFEAHLLTRAQEGEAGAEAGKMCAEALEDYLAEQETEFGAFINEHFRSPRPTSELIPTAIEKFREFRKKAKARAIVAPHGQTTTAAAAETQCPDILKKHFEILTNLLREHILTNAYAKKSTRLIDKYKQINEKLEKLNFTIAQTYGYFAALSQKLPCYASKCNK